MISYASRTGTKKNLQLLREFGWRLLVSPTGRLKHEGFPHALDNGAWTYFQKGLPFGTEAFVKALEMFGATADWVALPDIVNGGMRSFDLSLSWMNRVMDRTSKVLLPVQPGMDPDSVRAVLGPRVGVFVGGDTEFKENTMAMWCALARSQGAYSHVGRVNTARRIKLCAEAGADSFDGTSASRYADTIVPLTKARDRDLDVWRVARAVQPAVPPDRS